MIFCSCPLCHLCHLFLLTWFSGSYWTALSFNALDKFSTLFLYCDSLLECQCDIIFTPCWSLLLWYGHYALQRLLLNAFIIPKSKVLAGSQTPFIIFVKLQESLTKMVAFNIVTVTQLDGRLTHFMHIQFSFSWPHHSSLGSCVQSLHLATLVTQFRMKNIQSHTEFQNSVYCSVIRE